MGRGPDTKPRKQRALTWTAPILVTEEEAVWMGASTEALKNLEIVGSVSLPTKAPQPLYRYLDIEKSITSEGREVQLDKLKSDTIG